MAQFQQVLRGQATDTRIVENHAVQTVRCGVAIHRQDAAAREAAVRECCRIFGVNQQRRMLRLPADDASCSYRTMFAAPTAAEVRRHRRRGVSERSLRFLSKENDPRVYAIRHWRWVRTRGCRFYVWRLDGRTLALVRNADVFWKAQTGLGKYDMVDVVELATGKEFAVPAARLTGRGRDLKPGASSTGGRHGGHASTEPTRLSLFEPTGTPPVREPSVQAFPERGRHRPRFVFSSCCAAPGTTAPCGLTVSASELAVISPR